ncbi:MAG TPA: RHS repeat-associated core domain-containing protein [Sphingomicrobium sp.]|nr:RHS repeat-associated core domain-containing protein [Sphingomicrobium sp.]
MHGPGPSTGSGQAYDEPIVWYEGTGTSDRRFLSSDERGSIISLTNSSGTVLGLNRYDEYGQPQGPSGAGTLLGRFGFTGQIWLGEIGVYYYKARAYDPELGRFYQPDPIGHWDGPNLYAYVLNDPVNLTDPLGLQSCPNEDVPCEIVTGDRCSIWQGCYLPGTFWGTDRLFPPSQPPILEPIDWGLGEAIGGGEGVPCSLTAAQLRNSGPVTFTGASSAGYLLLGYGATAGRFSTASGLTGNFHATAVGFGLGTSYHVTGGVRDSLADFMGGSDNIHIATPAAEWIWSRGLSDNSRWNFASGGIGGSFGTAGTLAGALGTLRTLASFNIAVTFSVTAISNVRCPTG